MGESDDPDQQVRIDQWLHAVRLTKTRSEAASACRGGHVSINGKAAKPSTAVTTGDRVEAQLAKRERDVVVTRLLVKRVGAAVALECYDDNSPPPPEREPAEVTFAVRERGAGRPTKRDRRRLDHIRGRPRR